MNLISLILIKILIINVILIIKKKEKKIFEEFNYLDLKISLYKAINNTIIVLLFVFFYLGFFRILKIFKESEYINLCIIKQMAINNFSLIYVVLLLLIFLLIKNIKNITILFLKISFLKTNYYFQSRSDKYCVIYSFLSYWQYDLWHFIIRGRTKFKYKKQTLNFIYYFFKYVGYFLLFMFFLVDLFSNNYVLIYFSKFLPWFSLYQSLYIINNFFSRKIFLKNEFYIFTSLYIDFIYNKKLLNDYNNSNKKVSFDVFLNVSTNILGNTIPILDASTFEKNNNYILSLLE